MTLQIIEDVTVVETLDVCVLVPVFDALELIVVDTVEIRVVLKVDVSLIEAVVVTEDVSVEVRVVDGEVTSQP